jgi:hypothetical protein
MTQPLVTVAGDPAGPARRLLPRLGDCTWGYALLVPVLLACLAPADYFFDAPACLDSNMYVGYFLHYPDHLPLMDGYYKVSRLPWVLPGVACYRAFGAFRGSYVLALATMAFGLICLYVLLRHTLDQHTALVGVALLGTCRLFHGVGGWNYHMGMATDYYLLTVLCLVRAPASARAWRWYFLAGVALSLVVFTHLSMAMLAPGLAVQYVLSCRAAGRKLSTYDALAGGAGVLAATALLAVVSASTGGDFRFFIPQMTYTLWLAGHGNPWYQPLSAWLPAAHWLALPAAALLACPLIWPLIGRGAAGPGRSQVLVVAGFQAQLVLGVIACCYSQFVKHQTVLDNPYQAASLLGPGVLALSGLFYGVRQGWGAWTARRAFAVALATLGLPLLVASHWSAVPPALVAPGVLPAAVAVAGVLCTLGGRKSTAVLAAGLALFGLSNAAQSPWTVPENAARLNCEGFQFVLDAEPFASGLDPTLQDIKYWYDRDEMLTTPAGAVHTHRYFDSFVATRLWLGNLLGGSPVPPIRNLEAKHLGTSGRVAVLSKTRNKEDYCRRLAARFAELGLPLRREAERDFRHGRLEFSMVVFTVARPPSAERREGSLRGRFPGAPEGGSRSPMPPPPGPSPVE